MSIFMDEAIKEAYQGISKNEGGPFGCVIVKDNKIVGRGHNMVVKNNDPTAHGEVSAIRDACKNLNTFNLKGCELYTTGEPCPMCLGAILWANIDKVYYGCNIKDTEIIGFRDDGFYEFIKNNGKDKLCKELDRDACLKLYKDYSNIKIKTNY